MIAAHKIWISAASVVAVGSDDWGGKDHPNKMPFKGVLLILDVPSTKPPHGSRGHRILVPTKVASKHLDGLIGMAVNYDRGGLDSHATRHKVGIITKAWIQGNQVWVSGFIWKKDFPEAATDLKRRGLGMSMELANVFVRDEDEDVWHLEGFDFTGATILRKDAAAYYGTELAAKATAVASGIRTGEKEMAKTTGKEQPKVAAAGNQDATLLVEAIKSAMTSAVTPLVNEIRAANDRTASLADDLEELKGLHIIQAAKAEDDDDDDMAAGRHEDDDDDDMSAKSEDDDDDDMSAAKKSSQDDGDGEDDEEGDDEDLDAMEDLEEQAVDEEPGEVNEDSKNKGNKTSVTKPPKQGTPNPGGVSEGRLKSAAMKSKRPFPGIKSGAIRAAAVEIQTLQAQVSRLKKTNRQLVREMNAAEQKSAKRFRKLQGTVEALTAQAERYAESVNRKSVIPVEIRNLMAKASVDPYEIMAGSAPRVTVQGVDEMFKVAAEQGIQIDPALRAAYKNRMHELGLMESGAQEYGQN